MDIIFHTAGENVINQVFAGLAKIKKLWDSSPQLSPELLQELARLSGLEPPN